MPGEAGGQMPDIDHEIAAAKKTAESKIDEHLKLAEELAAIQKELERRVSLGKQPHGGQPWNPKRSSS